MPFELERSDLESGVVVLVLTGTLTMGNQLQRLEWTVEEASGKNQNRVVVDMSHVTYLDSSAIGVLIACSTMVKKAGGQLRLAGLTERVQQILQMTGIDTVIAIDADREAAIAAIGGGAGDAK